MTRARSIALAALLTSTLAACGGAGHPVCKDEATAQEYSRKFVTDMIAAAGRVSPEQMLALQSEMNGLSEGDSRDFSGFCTKLDGLRAKYGI